MFFAELLFAFVIALLMAGVLMALLGRGRPGAEGLGVSFAFLFLVLFLATWAGGVWITPFGPPVWGIAWVPFLVVGIIVALLLAALLPPRRQPRESGAPEAETAAGAAVLGGFFWALVLALAVVVIVRYVA